MYYEIFEELKNSSKITPVTLFNKSLLDSCFEIRSQINSIYNSVKDEERLIQKSYSYILYQRIVFGIAKSIFLGINPWDLGENIFTETNRLNVPQGPISIDGRHPNLYFKNPVLSYEHSCLKKWEDEVLIFANHLNHKYKLSITREGFKAHLNRVLEILFSMRSSSIKRRTNWTIFLHEFIMLQKEFSFEEIKQLGFEFESNQLIDKSFQEKNYLEFKHLQALGAFNSAAFRFEILEGSPLEQFSELNRQLIGKIPLVHFYLNEHMFVGKEEFSINQYVEFFVHPWTKGKDIIISYLENHSSTYKEMSLQMFSSELKDKKYLLVLGFHEIRDGKRIYFSAEPKMLKD